MAFKVAFEFSEADDLINLIAKIAVPAGFYERIEEMSGSMQSVIDGLRANVARLTSVEDSVQAFVEGVPAMIQAAVDQALAAGATPEQMQALTDLNAQLSAKVEELAGDVTANTPAAPAPSEDTVAGGGADTVPGTGEQPGEGVPPDATQPDTGTTVPPTDGNPFPQV